MNSCAPSITKAINVLLVEDNPGDRRLTREALEEGKLIVNLYEAVDGVEAMEFVRQQGKFTDAPEPDLILLDLNLPKKDGREVLAELKEDENLRHIPVVIMTSSEADTDILKCYDLHANCYVTKPVDLERFTEVVHGIEDFWFTIVKLAKR